MSNNNNEGFGKVVKLGVILFIVTAITGLILGAVNELTLGPIAVAQAKVKSDALKATLPEADDFEQVELAGGDTPVLDVQRAKNGAGCCLTVATKGYGGELQVVVGINSDGAVSAISVLTHSETPGLGAKSAEAPKEDNKFTSQFKGKSGTIKVTKDGGEIEAISGATITSRAVSKAVSDACAYWQEHLK